MTAASDADKDIHPTVAVILQDVVVQDDGPSYVENFASWILALRKLPAKDNPRLFVQLAVVAKQYSEAGCKPVALALAALAKIGLGKLVKA